MKTSKQPENILIITYDLNLNRTFTYRYFSFLKALKEKGHAIKGVGIDFSFKPHPINNLDKNNDTVTFGEDIITIKSKNLNFIQKLLAFSDRNNLPFWVKKYLLALHIIIYKTDQWRVDIKDLDFLISYKPTIVISGGSSGIIKSAYTLAKKHQAKFIIDYRDPLNFGYHLLETNKMITLFKRYFTIKEELRLLAAADEIITVSDSLKSFFPEEFKHKITVIKNGSNFEQEEIPSNIVDCPKVFNIVYLGTVYNDQLKDISFFNSLKTFMRNNHIKPQLLKLRFLGSSQNKFLPMLIRDLQLQDYTEITDRLNKETLYEYLLDASLFLHLKFGDRSQIITSKQADYLVFRKPILLPVSDNGDIAESIMNNNAGYVCNTVEENVAVLESLYEKFQKGESLVIPQSEEMLVKNSRSYIAKEFVELVLRS